VSLPRGSAGPSSPLRSLFRSRSARERIALRRLRTLLLHATRSPFHADRIGRAGAGAASWKARVARDPVSALRALPPVSKGELRSAGDAVFPDGVRKRGWRRSRSSGSTGEPFTVHFDRRSWLLLKYAVKLRARVYCGLRPHHRMAIVGVGDRRVKEVAARLPGGWLGRVRRLDGTRRTARIVAELDEFGPDVIQGLPSVLLEVAGAMRAGSLSPRCLFTEGELLTDGRRAALESAFGAPVYDVYGTSETKEIAWTCPAGGRHVNADVLHVELLDERGEPVPRGREGEIVVTVLVNRAMPLLRYRTGDRGIGISGTCPCGVELPLLGVLTGREAEVLELEGGRRLSPYRLTTALERVEGLVRYQVRQVAGRRLTVRAEVPRETDRAPTRSRIRGVLRSVLPADVEIGVDFVPDLGRRENGKFRIVHTLDGPGSRRSGARPGRRS